MKHKLLTASAALPIAMMLGAGAIYGLITAFGLPVEDPGRLFVLWTLCALGGCVLFSIPRSGLLVLTGSAAVLFWLWNRWEITTPLRALISRISVFYHGGYGWGVVQYAGLDPDTVVLDPLFALWGCVIILAAAGAVVKGRCGVGAVILSLPPLIVTMVVNDTPPDALPLFFYFTAVVLLMLTRFVARRDPLQGAKLAAMAVVPIALALGCLLLLCPKDTYVNKAQNRLDAISNWWDTSVVSLFRGNNGLGEDITPTPTASARTRLGSLGPRRVIPYEVMTVTADFSGSLYLRGQDYDKYDGMSWTSTLDRAENLPSSYYFAHRGTVTIATKQTMDVLYLPGYLNRDYRLTDGNLKNTGLQTEYQWSVSKLGMDPSAFVSSYVEDYSDVKQYLELPEATHEWADAYVLPFIGGHSAETVQAIVDHVGNSARYSLNTRRMDDSCGDFAQWFLEDSDTGYCVHFATAATVLLRAAGIPARYVTGYMVTCEAGETVIVESDRAHAWVEYFDPIARAWIIAEPTPPDLSEDEPEDESVTAPPPVTQPLTEPAETETAAPTEPVTRPIQIGGIPIDSKEESRILEILGWIILAAAVWAAIILQRILRIALRRRTLTGGPNRRALGLWQEVERISAFMKREPPEELLELAQKAKFSQYELTKEELRQFTAWLKEARKELRSRPIHQRIWCRYVLALW